MDLGTDTVQDMKLALVYWYTMIYYKRSNNRQTSKHTDIFVFIIEIKRVQVKYNRPNYYNSSIIRDRTKDDKVYI